MAVSGARQKNVGEKNKKRHFFSPTFFCLISLISVCDCVYWKVRGADPSTRLKSDKDVNRSCSMSDKRRSTMVTEFHALLCYLLTGGAG
jgi:hypothetical protein